MKHDIVLGINITRQLTEQDMGTIAETWDMMEDHLSHELGCNVTIQVLNGNE